MKSHGQLLVEMPALWPWPSRCWQFPVSCLTQVSPTLPSIHPQSTRLGVRDFSPLQSAAVDDSNLLRPAASSAPLNVHCTFFFEGKTTCFRSPATLLSNKDQTSNVESLGLEIFTQKNNLTERGNERERDSHINVWWKKNTYDEWMWFYDWICFDHFWPSLHSTEVRKETFFYTSRGLKSAHCSFDQINHDEIVDKDIREGNPTPPLNQWLMANNLSALITVPQHILHKLWDGLQPCTHAS